MKLTIPNQLTILRILLTPIFLYYFTGGSENSILIGTIIFTVAAATDWYDGYIARKFNVITRWGQFMDPLADKILVSSALFAFAYLNYLHWWMVITIVFRDFIITSLRMYALHHGKSIVTSQLAKWKTFLQMVALFILLLYLNFAGAKIHYLTTYPPDYTNWITILYLVVTGITVLSGIQYLIENRAHVSELGKRAVKIFYN